MSPRRRSCNLPVTVVISVALLLAGPLFAGQTGQPKPLDNDAILNMLSYKVSPAAIVAAISANPANTHFSLTPESLKTLADAGATKELLDAMFAATVKASKPAVKPEAGGPLPPPTQERLHLAQQATIEPAQSVKEEKNPCADAAGNPLTNHTVILDWESGKPSPGTVEHSGATCFELRNANTILFDFSFSLTEIPVEGSAADLLKSAIAGLPGIFAATGGVAATLPPQNTGPGIKSVVPCPAGLKPAVEAARIAGLKLQNSIAQLIPEKDATGKIKYIKLSDTLAAWALLPGQYDAFEVALKSVQEQLKNADLSKDPSICGDDLLNQAESVILDVYGRLRQPYADLAARASGDHIKRFYDNLESTSGYNVLVVSGYQGAETTAGSKTFTLAAGRKILNASIGFLITALPARSYSSRTAPNAANTGTQNVLGVDFGSGPRLAATALINVNAPWDFANRRHFGVALSTGPVFDVSNGKADTSRLGFFGGVSLRIWDQIYLTPGVHVGEFADFPQGFTAPGQIIPPNTGTPQAVKRYSARFAFGITYKFKDLGPSTSQSGNNKNTSVASGSAGKSSGGRGTTGSSGSGSSKPI
jgi:hypothetical protein